MRFTSFLFVLPLLAGCPIDVGDVDTDDPTEPPDITGVYTVLALSDVTGCEGVPEADTSWMEGPLVIDGPADALTFTFEGGEILDGAIDTAFEWSVAGTVDRNPVLFDVVGEGLALIGDVTWKLSGDVAVAVADSTDGPPTCTLTGRLEAEQDPP